MPKESFLKKIKKEIKYLRLKEWGFSDVGSHWDNVEGYDDINDETYSYFRRFIDGYKLSDIGKDSYTLDICARTGNGTLYFAERGLVKKAVCADFSRAMQSICSGRLKKAGIEHKCQLIERLPFSFKDGEFDAVLCFETIEHVMQPDIFIKELARVTKKGGQLVITTPNVLWRLIHSIAAVFDLHHSEGPCRFIGAGKLHRYIKDAGLDIIKERTTVIIPAGPRFLTRFGERLEQVLGDGIMRILGLRQVVICRRKE